MQGLTRAVNAGDRGRPERLRVERFRQQYRLLSWTQTAGTPVTLSNAAVANPTLTAPARYHDGTSLTFQLTVTDNGGLSATDTCIVNVTPVAPANRTPTADAGPDQTVVENTPVALVGSNSSDPDGTIATYAWRQTAGTNVTLSNAAAASPTFTAPLRRPGRNWNVPHLPVDCDG